MDKITKRQINKWIKDYVKLLRTKYGAEKIILFGSRAKGTNLKYSDVDLIVISKKFEGINWLKRIGDLSQDWEGLIDLDILGYTPEEFEKKKNQLCIVQQAVKEGKILFSS